MLRLFIGHCLSLATPQEEWIFPSVLCTALFSGAGTQEALTQPPLVNLDPQPGPGPRKSTTTALATLRGFSQGPKEKFRTEPSLEGGGRAGQRHWLGGSSQRKKKNMPVPQSCHRRPALAHW